MPVVQAGSINTTALVVPDLFVQVVPPSVSLLNGVPTNLLGVVGTAGWGPVNSPVPFSTMADYSKMFGSVKARKFDMGTAVNAAVLQGANNFIGVRVTDGTDMAATGSVSMDSDLATVVASAINNGGSGRGPSELVVASVSGGALVLTALYTGTGGNSMTISIGAGSAADTTKVTVSIPNGIPEVFDNIPATGEYPTNFKGAYVPGSTYTIGDSVLFAGLYYISKFSDNLDAPPGFGPIADRSWSAFIPFGTHTVLLADGTDGATTINTSVLIGVDAAIRKGMYALRSTGASIGMLADADDTTQWAVQLAFGLSEGIYMIGVGPMGQSVTAFATAMAAAGCDSYAFCAMVGDWVYFNDTVNSQTRLISPQGFKAGKLAVLAPQESSLNKPIYGVVGTQRSASHSVYSNAELQVLSAARGEVITNPSPGGKFFSCRFGRNCSSNAVIHGDNYTRMTNYIAYTLNAGMGRFVGRLQTPTEREEAWAAIDYLLTNMANTRPEPMIGDVNGGPSHQVILDSSNNPSSRVALGYQQADVKVVYLSVIEEFLINVEGGQSVSIQRLSTASV